VQEGRKLLIRAIEEERPLEEGLKDKLSLSFKGYFVYGSIPCPSSEIYLVDAV